MSFTITLASVQEVEQVIFALAEKPYKEVYQLINNIHQQTTQQMIPQQPTLVEPSSSETPPPETPAVVPTEPTE